MRRKRITTLKELKDLLKDDIRFFEQESKNTQNQELKDIYVGRIKEAEWIMSLVAVD